MNFIVIEYIEKYKIKIIMILQNYILDYLNQLCPYYIWEQLIYSFFVSEMATTYLLIMNKLWFKI